MSIAWLRLALGSLCVLVAETKRRCCPSVGIMSCYVGSLSAGGGCVEASLRWIFLDPVAFGIRWIHLDLAGARDLWGICKPFSVLSSPGGDLLCGTAAKGVFWSTSMTSWPLHQAPSFKQVCSVETEARRQQVFLTTTPPMDLGERRLRHPQRFGFFFYKGGFVRT